MGNKVALVAFGGNAILKAGEEGHQWQQFKNAEEACSRLIGIIKQGYELIIVHGNGPQVGNILLQVEAAKDKVKPFTLDVCGAMSQGSMGYMLAQSMYNQFKKNGISKNIAVILSQVVVDRNDPMFKNPTKPIGPFYTKEVAEKHHKEDGWDIVEDAGRGYRRVVASPIPIEVVEWETVNTLVKAGTVVVAGGGGGIPVYYDEKGMLRGIEAVIDKDYTASLLARKVNADLFIILTDAECVYLDFGKPTARAVPKMTVNEAEEYLKEGQFPPGSMGPKIRAAINFIRETGKEVLITSAPKLWDALEGKTGTRIVR